MVIQLPSQTLCCSTFQHLETTIPVQFVQSRCILGYPSRIICTRGHFLILSVYANIALKSQLQTDGIEWYEFTATSSGMAMLVKDSKAPQRCYCPAAWGDICHNTSVGEIVCFWCLKTVPSGMTPLDISRVAAGLFGTLTSSLRL